MNNWKDISTAPSEKVLLVWGGGPIRFGIRDKLGNWRARHNGPIKEKPKYWMELPEAPAGEAK